MQNEGKPEEVKGAVNRDSLAEHVARAIHRAVYEKQWGSVLTDDDQGVDWMAFEIHAIAAIAALSRTGASNDKDTAHDR